MRFLYGHDTDNCPLNAFVVSDVEWEYCFVGRYTFINIPSDATGGIGTISHRGLIAKNNSFYSSDTGLPNGNWTDDRKHYHDSGGESDTNGTARTGDPFENFAGLDFDLESNTTAGGDLRSPYNVNRNGQTRSTWTRGALELGSSGDSAPIGTLNVQNFTVTRP